MQDNLLFEEQVMKQFNFKNDYIAYVIDNSSFETDFTVKAFIPELFGFQYEKFEQNNQLLSNINKDFTLVSIDKNSLSNPDEINIKSEIQKSNFVIARILIERHSFRSKEDFIFDNKPNIGDKILIKFLNDNPLNCVFTNTLFLGDNEDVFNYINE